jgi:hypothetical protein
VSDTDVYTYEVELHGLSPWTTYRVSYGIVVAPTGAGSGCYDVVNSTSLPSFMTNYEFPLSEEDQPFDSMTETGGGATFAWGLPQYFLKEDPVFVSGNLTYLDDATGNTTVVPLSPSTINGTGSGPGWYAITLPLATLNTPYSANVSLTYQIGTTYYYASSPALAFVYLRDTSGDGLTDVEKYDGWTVTTTGISGQTSSELVTANPSAYATNGLVSDYIEKEFGLNPNTVDTAGSDMLDTWNLTFAYNGTLPTGANFEIWNESSYHPFAKNVTYAHAETPGGDPLTERGYPIESYLSNISASSTSSGDGSPWASEVLWSDAALRAFVNLSGVRVAGPLRAIAGSWNGTPTLTFWGKLSWGANPLAQSTLNDGILDGQQADPAETEVVQLTVTQWSASQPHSSYYAGPFFQIGGGAYYDGYGPVESGSPASFSGTYVISAPVRVFGQDVSYNFSINENDSVTSSHHPVLLSSGLVEIDLLGTGYGSLNVTNGSEASVTGWYHVLRVAEASNTILWTPANNTTLSSEPWGLKRYTGEPDFDLLVLNLSAPTTVTGIEGAEGGWHYSETLPAGLTNILVPRGAFLTSALGEALLNNTNLSLSAPSGSGLTFTPGDWSGRSETSGTNSPGNSNFIWVFSTTTQSEQNTSNLTGFGGVPGNPAAESGYESRQVQSVIWINVTSNGNGLFSNASNELRDLFGGLILNESGNMSGDLLDMTSELGTLGLPAAVISALANVTLNNSGAYAPPKFQTQSSSPSFWSSLGSGIWNTLSGIAETTGLSKLGSVFWNAIQSAAAYIGEAAAWLSNHLGLGRLANQFAKGLKTLVSSMEWAIQALAQAILLVLKAAVSLVVGAIDLALEGYLGGVTQGLDGVLSGISTSPISLSSTLLALGSLTLDILGFAGFVQTLNSIFSRTMSLVQPVLSLISLNQVIQAIGSVIESGSGLGIISQIQGAISSIHSFVYSTISDMVSGIFNALGLSSRSLSYSGPAPTGAGLTSLVTSTANDSGNSSVTGAVGTATSGWSASLDVLDAVHVGIVLGVLLFLSLQGLSLASPGWPSGISTLQEWADAGFPPSPALPGFVALVRDLCVEFLGLLLDVIASLMSSSLFEAITLGVIGDLLAIFSTIDVATDPRILATNEGAAPYLLTGMFVGDVVGGVIPVVEAAEA